MDTHCLYRFAAFCGVCIYSIAKVRELKCNRSTQIDFSQWTTVLASVIVYHIFNAV